MSDPFEFRTYQPLDRDACLALFDENCPEFFAANERADYAAFLETNVDGYRVCAAQDHIVAAFGVIAIAAPGRRRLSWILVSSAWQGRGVGKAIMAEVRRMASEAGVQRIDIAASHKSAPFFARFGAEETNRLTDGWGPGMHRVDMELPLVAVNRAEANVGSGSVLFSTTGGHIVLPQQPIVSRPDGGHLIVNPPREVWERSELTKDELTEWSILSLRPGVRCSTFSHR